MAKVNDKDFDIAPTSVEDEHERMRAFMARYNTNTVAIAGVVRSKFIGDSKPKIDKKTNDQIIVDGTPQFWEPFRSVTIAFEGGEMDINLSEDMFDNVQEGERYIFQGNKGLSYGRVQDKFHNIIKVS